MVLLELQSSPDPEMALRVLVYVGLFYQRLLKAEPRAPGEKLPPVLPIVLYNGDAAWSAPLDVAEMIEPASEGLERYRPSLRHLVIDERRVPEDLLAGVRNLVAALIRLEKSEGPQEVRAIVDELIEWLHEPEQRGRRQTFATWLRLVLRCRTPPESCSM